MTRSLILVNWRSASHVMEAVRSARASSSEALEIIVVDNSCDADEARLLDAAGVDRVLVSPENLGYGGGVNRGVAEATGDLLIIANPDVRFTDDSIDILARSVRDGHAVAGPRFVWDDAGSWFLPPPTTPGLVRQLIASLSTRARWVELARDRSAARARIEFWSAEWPKSVHALSGAVLALPRTLFQRVGGFDPRFHLYFEEIDLLRRIRRGGGTLIHQPRAVVRHLFNQSGALRPDREAIFLESERLFHRKWFGTSVLLRIARTDAEAPPVPVPYEPGAPVGSAVWLEASPEPRFASGAGFRLEGNTLPRLPVEMLGSLGGGSLWIRGLTGSGREAGRWRQD